MRQRVGLHELLKRHLRIESGYKLILRQHRGTALRRDLHDKLLLFKQTRTFSDISLMQELPAEIKPDQHRRRDRFCCQHPDVQRRAGLIAVAHQNELQAVAERDGAAVRKAAFTPDLHPASLRSSSANSPPSVRFPDI